MIKISDKKRKGQSEPPFELSQQSTDCHIVSHQDYSTNNVICQDFTENKEVSEKFTDKRKWAEVLSASYTRLDKTKRADRVKGCGTYLEFAHQIDGNGSIDSQGKLHNANFCRDRLCPMCAWRRAIKIFSQVSKIMDSIVNDYEFIFLTLTIPNVSADELKNAIDELQKGWAKLIRKKPIKNVLKGYFKALECTRNKERDDYHPHFHCVLAVPKSYYKKDGYIKQAEWLELWRECMGDERITQVDVRRFKSKPTENELNASKALASAVAEVAKYAVKAADYLSIDTAETDKVVSVFSEVLHGRRLCDFDTNGAFGQARAKLKLDDAEDGDLIHIDEDPISPAVAWLIVRYGWSAGAYEIIDSSIRLSSDL